MLFNLQDRVWNGYPKFEVRTYSIYGTDKNRVPIGQLFGERMFSGRENPLKGSHTDLLYFFNCIWCGKRTRGHPKHGIKCRGCDNLRIGTTHGNFIIIGHNIGRNSQKYVVKCIKCDIEVNRSRGKIAYVCRNCKHINAKGYKWITVDGIKIKEHIHVMERHIGRTLYPNEVVHHRDGIKRNNAISNLQLLTKNTHHSYQSVEDMIVFCSEYLSRYGYEVKKKKGILPQKVQKQLNI